MVEAMEIQKGFKKTEVGLIPADWDLKNIIENSTLKARIGWQGLTVAEYLNKGDYFLITGTDFVDGKIKWDTCHYVNKIRYAQDKNIQVKIGDILITKDGTIGKVAYVDRLPLNATLNSGVFVIRPKGNIYLPLFLFYIFNSFYFRDFLNNLVAGSTIIHLYQKDFVSFSFPLPPTKAEQTAIAEALNDADALIAELEKLIAKKKAIKQGTMQKLLKPKEGWVEKSFTEICDLVHGHQFLTSDFIKSKDGIKIIRISNVQDGKFNLTDCDCISKERLNIFSQYLLNEGDILMSLTGNIGRVVVLPKLNEPLLQNYRVGKFVPKDVDKLFLAYGLASQNTTKQLAINSNQTSQANFGKQDFKKIKIFIPLNNEIQSYIANILKDIDAEIEALEKKLDKYKMLKQGMMQNLLTGKIRLV